ncbi:MAG TPA: glycosyltransferase family 87 protein, partial [Polyangiaceae bacterium]|nr:glycosyltransferase family 87 protein [Polyangiaceae bacterium]
MTALRRRDIALVALSVVPFVYTLFDTSDGDVPLYRNYANLLWGGAVPYKDWRFEYPPYALVWLAAPGLFSGYTAFRAAFSLQILALDVVAKLALLKEGHRLASGSPWSRLAPFLVFSSLAVFQSYFYLKRFDAIAAGFTLFALLAFARGRFAAAGALVSVATGIKLYPGLVALVLACAAWQRGKSKQFATGAIAALMPVVAFSAFAPWWRFISFHASRGLQVESTYASIVWLAHFFGVQATWASRPAWVEVDGPTARAVLPFARVLFATGTLGALATSVAAVWHRNGEPSEASS